MDRITYQKAEEILGGRVDRRAAYYFEDTPESREMFLGGPVYTYGEWTTECSGCTESEMGHYYTGRPGQGIGCSECGYTGKRRDGFFVPACVKANVRNEPRPGEHQKS